MKMKNRSHRYGKNTPRSRPGHKYSNKKVPQYDYVYMY